MEKAIRGSGHKGEGVSDSRRSMHMDKGGDKVKCKVNQMGEARHKREWWDGVKGKASKRGSLGEKHRKGWGIKDPQSNLSSKSLNHAFVFFRFLGFFSFSPRLKKMIYAAPSIRGPHSPLAGKHCCEEHNGSNSKGRRCLLSFQKPWEWLTGQTAPKKKSCLLQLFAFFSCRDCSFYIQFPSTKKRLQDYRSRQKSWETENKSRELGTKAHSEGGDKAQMRNESKWGDAERGRTTRWGTKSHRMKSLSISNSSPVYVYVPCANTSSQWCFIFQVQGGIQSE